MRGRFAFVIAAMTVVTACSAGQRSAAPLSIAETQTTTSSLPAVPVASFTTGPSDDHAAPDGTLAVTNCSWLWFGRYRFDLTWQPSTAAVRSASWNATALLSEGDVVAVAASGVLHIDGAPGAVSVEVDAPISAPVALPGSHEIARASRSDSSVPTGASCTLEIGRSIIEGPTLVFRPDPPTGLVAGSLQALAATTMHNEAPLLPLAGLFEQLPEPPFDRLYVSPSRELLGVIVERDGTCLHITQQYVGSANGRQPSSDVVVSQTRGCTRATDPPSPQSRVDIADPNWSVSVLGEPDAVHAVAAELTPETVAGAEPSIGRPTVGPDNWVAGYLAERPNLVELARFPWRDGVVVITRNTDVSEKERYEQPVVFLPNDPSDKSLLIVGCREQTVGIATFDDGGYAWVVSADAARGVSLPLQGGQRFSIQLSAVGDVFVGFADLDGVAYDTTASLGPFDATGAPLPCTQN